MRWLMIADIRGQIVRADAAGWVVIADAAGRVAKAQTIRVVDG